MKNSLSKMQALDIYLDSLSSKDIKAIEEQIHPENMPSPLMSLDIHSQAFHKNLMRIRRERELKILEGFSKEFSWNINLEAILENCEYDALILTDKSQSIMWVNKGFKDMTGYSANFAKNKRPSFLQGKETSQNARNSIREKLKLNQPFTEKITNYKKNNEAYICEVNIYPLKTNNQVHYLALEKEIYEKAG